MECVSMFPQMLSYTLTKVYNSMAETLMETCFFLGNKYGIYGRNMAMGAISKQ
jgi:hypothetical protein